MAQELNRCPAAAARQASPGSRKSGRRLRRRILLAIAAAGLLVCAILAGVAKARGDKLTPIKDLADFRQQVLLAKQPVLVEFYKGGCPTCLALAPTLARLADEYRGRAVIARFELMKPYFAVTSDELKQRYDISLYPTVILFVSGQEKKRWALNYSISAYRKALDAAIAGLPGMEPEPARGGPHEARPPDDQPQPPPSRETTGNPASPPFIIPRPSGGTVTEK